MTPIRFVAIIGGTHGNEFTGPHLLKHWGQDTAEIYRPSFTTTLFLANPKAFEQNRRFIDADLNRSFTESALKNPDPKSYESTRASYLNDAIGPRADPKFDFIIDLHTSTSNCGAMIIVLTDDAFTLRLAAYLSTKIERARIHYIPFELGGQQALGSLAPHSLAVEVGPVAQGMLRRDIYELTRSTVSEALNFVEGRNTAAAFSLPSEIEVFKFQESLSFPGDGLYADAMIHESLQDRDYEPLHPGDPLFRRLDGSVITYDGPEIVYPVFINEAAYFKQRKAMSLTSKEVLQVPDSE